MRYSSSGQIEKNYPEQIQGFYILYFVQDSFFIPVQKNRKSKKKDIQKSNCNNKQKLHVKIMQL